MMIVHQAIYGDKSGSYALLKTSLTDIELAKRICNVTDLLDRPSNGHLTQPVLRSFPFNDNYLFIKSFPDDDPSVRRGRVMSHTLIVEQSDLPELNDLNKLFSLFLSESDKDAELHPISFDDIAAVLSQATSHTPREAAAINGLLELSHYKKTLVWIGEEGYLPFIKSVWSQLNGNIRATIQFGIGFNPQKELDTKLLRMLCVPEDYANKWQNGNYFIVGKTDTGRFESKASFLLAGNDDKAKSLNDLIHTFGIIPPEIEDLACLEKVISTYENLSTISDLNRLIIFCDLISKYSPEEYVARSEKKKLLNHLSSCLTNATSSQIVYLKNANWSGFLNASKVIGKQIGHWVEKTIFISKSDESIVKVISTAFDETHKVEWWKEAVRDGLKGALKNWEPPFAIAIWNWFAANQTLVENVGVLLPKNLDVESHLVDYWPQPEPKLARKIQALAIERKWLALHGLSTLQLHSPEESIRRQLEIDMDPAYLTALQEMSEVIGDEEFIKITVEIGESRLQEIASEYLAKMPSLMGQLDVRNIFWRQLWLKSIMRGNNPWNGIDKPEDVLFLLLEEIVNGNAVEPDLLLKLSSSAFNDLSDFKRRDEVWQHLRGQTKSDFLDATSIGVVKKLILDEIDINSIEQPLADKISSDVFMTNFLNEYKDNIEAVIKVYESYANLKDKFLSDYVQYFRSSISDVLSMRLGSIVNERKFSETARSIYNKSKYNQSFKIAFGCCKGLVNPHWWETLVGDKNESFKDGHVLDYQNKNEERKIKDSLPTVVILTAIQEEYSAVRCHLKDIVDVDQNDTAYEAGIFEFNENEIAKVIIRECGAKNTTAALETERAIQHFKPDCMFFVGIAGSRKPNDFSVGDVIFPEKTYSYESGKSEKESFKVRPDSAILSYRLMELAKKERRKPDWKILIKNQWEKDVKADLGIIASGEQIVEHYNSAIGRILTDHFNDTSAVEMEGFGFAKAANRQGRETSNILIGIVRGISDIIEQPEGRIKESHSDRRPDNAKQFASDTAAAFAFWLIFKTYG